MTKKEKQTPLEASSNLQAQADRKGYSVISPEFANMEEVLAAASFQDAGIQTKNIGTDTDVDNGK